MAIAYGRKKANGELDFQIASGFLYQKEGIAVFVTAGHVVDDPVHGIKAWEDAKSLEFVSLMIPNSSGGFSACHLESWKAAKTWTDAGFDLACMPISDTNQQLMWEKGVKPMPVDRLMAKEVSDLPAFVFGYSALGVQVSERQTMSFIHEGDEYARIFSSITGLTYDTIAVQPPQSKSNAILVSKTYDRCPSFRGMSGGFVVELILVDDEIRVNWLGVQYCEANVDRSIAEDVAKLGDKKPLDIRYINSRKVCDLLDVFLSELRDNFDRLDEKIRSKS